MTDKYILDGHTPAPEPDLMKWAKWFEAADRTVAKDKIGDVTVSTVFLGLDHNFGNGDPHLFETMVFGGPMDQFQARSSTWDEAKAEHADCLRIVRNQ